MGRDWPPEGRGPSAVPGGRRDTGEAIATRWERRARRGQVGLPVGPVPCGSGGTSAPRGRAGVSSCREEPRGLHGIFPSSLLFLLLSSPPPPFLLLHLLLLPPLLLPLPLPFPRRAGGRSRRNAAVRMPQLPGAGGGGGDPELCATDEMIPFKDEGDPQKEKIFAEISHPEEEGDLADIKSSLVNESEIAPGANGHEVSRQTQAQDSYHDKGREHPEEGKHPDSGLYSKGPSYSGYSGYIMMPNMNNDPYMPNGSLSPPIPRTSNKVPVVQPSHAVHPLTPLITYSDEHFSPGSHPSHIPSDVSSKQGMSRHPPAPDLPTFYPLSPGGVGQITPPLGWQGQPVYPISSGFRQPYPSSLSVDPSMSRFSHHMIPGPPGPHTTGIPHPAIVTPQVKQEHPHNDSELMHVKPQHEQRKEQEPKRPHIKKPLNAFMLYMKEMRANVVAECTLKESAAINQILGRRWHALSREEQAKYYELARKERQLHMQLYPGWSARDNYGKKKKRKREKLQESASGGKRNAFSTCKAKAATPGPLLEMEAC